MRRGDRRPTLSMPARWWPAWAMLALSASCDVSAGGAMPAAGAALVGLLPLGRKFLSRAIAALSARAGLRDYRAIFRDLTRWSLIGVVLTELTVNAHAYLVTFISGPGPFALLALGMLLMRPASLVQSALPDLERPAMTRADRRQRLNAALTAHPARFPLRPARGLAGNGWRWRPRC